MRLAMCVIGFWAMLGLAACGGGGDSAGGGQIVEQGIFLDGAVQGLRYRTPSRSGITGADGRFQYVAGEVVTFSVGDIELGSAPGAARITPFELAGATRPETELPLRTELNRMRTAATPLSRAACMTWLLLALDADGDPANGLDLRHRGDDLRGAQVDFGSLLAEFPAELEGLAPGLNAHIPAGRALIHLFRSLNVVLPGGVPTHRFADAGDDGVDDAGVEAAFDASGAVASFKVDRSLDGDVDTVVSYQRGLLGRLIRQQIDDDLDGNGDTDYSRRVGREYDGRGNLLLLTDLESGDGLPWEPSNIRRSASYDEFGRAREEIQERRDAQGRLVARDRFVHTRDARGNAVLSLGEYDDGADGSIDLVARTTSEFDAANRVRRIDDSQDSGDDGRVDWRQLSKFEYDDAGRVSDFVQSTDFDGDGHSEHVAIQRLWYDAAGNVERVLLQVTDERGGELDGLNEHRFTYDSDRRLLTQVNIFDRGADGVPDERVEVADTYDSNGMKRGRQVSWLDLRTGALIRSSRVEIRYDARGARIGETTSWDFDGDGIFESRESQRIDYSPVADALGQIVDEYFGI